MPTVDLHGPAAIQMIVSRAGPELSKLWDGSVQRVGFILQQGPDGMQLGFFPSRAVAATGLREIAAKLPEPLAGSLRYLVKLLVVAPAATGIECVLVGWGACLTVEINPEDLRAQRGMGIGFSNEDINDVITAAATQAGSLDALRKARSGLREAGVELAELDALERVLEHDWNDTAKVALATSRAADAADKHLGLAAGQRARFVLMLMAETFGKRGGQINTRGGDA